MFSYCVIQLLGVLILKADARAAYKLLDKKVTQYATVPCKLTFDLLTLKVVSESRVTILVFLGLSVLDLGWMYETDRHQTRIIA